jgi:hypothetical protein
MAAINKKTCIDDLYTLDFKGEEVEIYARSEAEAMQRAIQHFRPKKRERLLVGISKIERLQ